MRSNDKYEDESDRRRHLQDTYASGSWFMFRRDFLASMGATEALFLSYLINHARTVGAEEKYNGWFYCPMGRIVRDLFLYGPVHQSRIMKQLITKGFVETEKRGMPPVRWIRIDYEAIRNKIDNDYADYRRKHEDEPQE
jgi:hypothetical protein